MLDGSSLSMELRVGGVSATNLNDEVARRFQTLTPCELLVLRAMCSTPTCREISRSLGKKENTIRTQQKAVFRKLGVPNTTAAALLAITFGYAQVDLKQLVAAEVH